MSSFLLEIMSLQWNHSNGPDTQAVTNLRVQQSNLKAEDRHPEGTTLLTENLLLYDKMQWKIAQFFLCIGEKEIEGKVRMNWPAVPGAKGKATIEVTPGRDDPNKKFNHVKKYLPYEPKKFEAGKF